MKRAIPKRLWFVVAGLMAAWPACEFLERPSEKVVLSVGSRKITPEELKAQRKRMALEPDGTGKEGLEAFVEKVVDHYLILEYGQQQGLTVSDEELESAVREIKKDYSEKDFQELLLKGYIEYKEWKEGLREQLLIKKITEKTTAAGARISPEEIKAYYDSHPEEFRRPAVVRFRHIVTRTREEADNLQRRLAQGGDMAETVAQSFKVPASAGSLEPGWFARGDLDESIEKVVFALPVGKASGVVETPYGFHILEVLGRKPEGVRSLYETMAEIEIRLRSERMEVVYSEWLQDLRKSVPVSIDLELLKEMELG
ncbi:MAG: peptidyl-prolyl cis-trans isomerase [Deltaproteobacteria bacterium]